MDFVEPTKASLMHALKSVGWVEPFAKPIIFADSKLMGIAEFIIGRAFARPGGSTHPWPCLHQTMILDILLDITQELGSRA